MNASLSCSRSYFLLYFKPSSDDHNDQIMTKRLYKQEQALSFLAKRLLSWRIAAEKIFRKKPLFSIGCGIFD